MRKGFTLIELLAVIVILAIVALISTPLILNVIEDAKKESFKNAAYGIVEAAKIQYAQGLLSGTNGEVIFTYSVNGEEANVSGKTLNYKGKKPSKGEVIISKSGKVGIAIYDGKFCAKKGFEKTEVELTEKTFEECKIPLYIDDTKAPMPELTEEMIPIWWDKNKWVKANRYEEWYNYEKQEWANVVLVTEETREYYKMAIPGEEIKEEDVLAYLVWIPRYKYRLFNVGTELISPKEIEIVFEDKNTNESTGTSNGEWLTHPAFNFGDDKLNGFWVGKFETTGVNSKPTIKPMEIALTSLRMDIQYDTARLFNNETVYGITEDLDAHMMKNMEWGAIAYLSHSKYGKYGNTMYTDANKEIFQNKARMVIGSSTKPVTGYSNGTSSQTELNEQCPYYDKKDRGSGFGACGAGASTTGNIYGIYDMSGGGLERVMAGMLDESGEKLVKRDSGFDETTVLVINNESFIGSKYVDIYEYGNSPYTIMEAYIRRKLGDATSETRDWYNDISYFVYNVRPWFDRGGYFDTTDGSSLGYGAGIFSFENCNGGSNHAFSFRVVVSYLGN